jgi:hypothetical protein
MTKRQILVMFLVKAMLLIIVEKAVSFSQTIEDGESAYQNTVINKSQAESVNYSVVLPPFYLFETDIEKVRKNKPIFILYHSGFHAAPRIYFALWEDGNIVWRMPNDSKQYAFNDPSAYLQCRISRECLELFLAKINEIDIWEHSGREIVPLGTTTVCELWFEYNGQVFCVAVIDISWPNYPYEYPPKTAWGALGRDQSPIHELAGLFSLSDKWQAIINEVEALIPQEGKRVALPLKRDPYPGLGFWTAYIQAISPTPTPSLLRQRRGIIRAPDRLFPNSRLLNLIRRNRN